MSKKYAATSAMVENQSKGRALKKKKTARSYSSPYEMTAKSFNDELTLDDVKATYSFLVKQKEKINKYNVDTDGQATEAYLDWLDGGATAGLAFTTMILQEEGILKSVTKQIDEKELESVEKSKWTNIQVCKATNEELMQGTFLVLQPEVPDAHGDIYSADEIRKGCHNFNLFCGKANMMHLVETSCFDIVESYIAPVEMVLGEQIIKAGSWLSVCQFWTEDVWKSVKDGDFCGVSIGCTAKVEYLEEDDND